MKDSLNLTHLKLRNMDKAISQATSESLVHFSVIFPFSMHISLCYYKYSHESYCCLHFILTPYVHTHTGSHHPYFPFFFGYTCQLSLTHHFISCTFKRLIDIIFFNLTPFVYLPICDRQRSSLMNSPWLVDWGKENMDRAYRWFCAIDTICKWKAIALHPIQGQHWRIGQKRTIHLIVYFTWKEKWIEVQFSLGS